jgi:hypothetical protein
MSASIPPPQAIPGGPSFATQPTTTTTFPVLQSVIMQSGSSLAADTATMTAGSSFDFAFCTGCRETFALSVPSLGLSSIGLNTFADTPFTASAGNGRNVEVDEQTWVFTDLLWLKFGAWSVSPPLTFSAYSYGYQTPASAIPTSGTVTYSSRVRGEVFYVTAPGAEPIRRLLTGTAVFQVNFATRAVTGQMTDVRVHGGAEFTPWNSASFSATLTANESRFNGTTNVTSSTGAETSLNGSGQGTVAGQFYGPSGQEIGLVWTLHDGTKAALGSIGGKRAP